MILYKLWNNYLKITIINKIKILVVKLFCSNYQKNNKLYKTNSINRNKLMIYGNKLKSYHQIVSLLYIIEIL